MRKKAVSTCKCGEFVPIRLPKNIPNTRVRRIEIEMWNDAYEMVRLEQWTNNKLVFSFQQLDKNSSLIEISPEDEEAMFDLLLARRKRMTEKEVRITEKEVRLAACALGLQKQLRVYTHLSVRRHQTDEVLAELFLRAAKIGYTKEDVRRIVCFVESKTDKG